MMTVVGASFMAGLTEEQGGCRHFIEFVVHPPLPARVRDQKNSWFSRMGHARTKGSAMTATRIEHDSLGPVNVPADKLWGAQTQRSLEHFSIGDDLIPREMIPAYAVVKKAAALVNHRAGRLGDTQKDLIVRVCDEV